MTLYEAEICLSVASLLLWTPPWRPPSVYALPVPQSLQERGYMSKSSLLQAVCPPFLKPSLWDVVYTGVLGGSKDRHLP